MADRTPIEWADATWNPVVGCTRVSEGCRHCYAERLARRFSRPGQWGEGLTSGGARHFGWTGEVRLVEPALAIPLRWRRPRRIFVCSTSDLFHERAADEAIDRVFAVMALCPQHTFLVLTKRPERMREYLEQIAGERDMQRWGNAAVDVTGSPCAAHIEDCDWPLPHVWLGASVEDQATANARIPHLLQTPAARRFVSYEPALGPVDFSRIPFIDGDCRHSRNVLTGKPLVYCEGIDGSPDFSARLDVDTGHLDWIIAGGESGPGARPAHPDWFRQARDQAAAAGVPFFFKQWGDWRVIYDRDVDDPDLKRCDTILRETPKGRWLNLCGGHGFHGDRVVRAVRVGKKRAGRLLDGRTWDEVPA
ncbi:MAG: phage Gp37/Gp68 family protein [Rhodospirillales bacterium]